MDIQKQAGKERSPFSKSEFLKRILKTLEFLNIDRVLLDRFRINIDDEEKALSSLESYNHKVERKENIKILRPMLHGYDEHDKFTRLIQEAYVTAKLFKAEDRWLNSLWSADWVAVGK